MKKMCYAVQATSPDGKTTNYFFKELADAVEISNRIDVCRGWSASVWARIGGKWILL